jgi:choline dehydrogenase
MHVQRPEYQHEFTRRFLTTCATHGAEINSDLGQEKRFNDWSSPEDTGAGYGPFELSQRNGERWTSAASYLAVAAARKNVTILTGHIVSRVTLSSEGVPLAATGVAIKGAAGTSPNGGSGEALLHLAEGGEVILTAGAIASPQLLQLSGIGDPSVLKAAGVPVKVAMPGVGEGLQDQPAVNVSFETKTPDGRPDLFPLMPYLNVPSPVAFLKWAVFGSGVLSTSYCDTGAFFRSTEELDLPDLQIRFLAAIGPDPDGVKTYELSGKGILYPNYGFSMQVINCRPKSSGSVRIVSPDPWVAPEIRCNYLQNPADLRALQNGIEAARRLSTAGALGEVITSEVYPGPKVENEEQLVNYIRGTMHSSNGLSGGCCLGNVVDEKLNVRGVKGLRVADASVMPSTTGAQLALPTTMIAERAAGFIRANMKAA